MNIRPILLPFAAAILVAGCTDGSAERAAEAVVSPVTAPVNALVNNTAPLPQQSQYTYWRKKPGTNLFEPYVTDRPLTQDEQEKLGILPPAQ